MVPCRARTMATSTWLMFFRLNSITETQQTAVRARYPHVTTARAGRSAVSSASDSMTVVGAAAALSCLAKLVGLCGRGVTCRSRLQGRGMYRVSKSEQSCVGQACNTPAQRFATGEGGVGSVALGVSLSE